jgi:predicted acyltransferase (DUF342 family)
LSNSCSVLNSIAVGEDCESNGSTSVRGDSYIGNSLFVENQVTFNQSLSVSGHVKLVELEIIENLTAQSYIRGSSDCSIEGDFEVYGSEYIHGFLYAAGPLTVSETLTASSSTSVHGNFYVGSSFNLGSCGTQTRSGRPCEPWIS